jgi:hypothetical protein
VYSALKSVTVNDEICKEIERLGGVGIVTNCLSWYMDEERVPVAPGTPSATPTPGAMPSETEGAKVARMVRCGMAVLRAVANSDTIKVKMCAGDAAAMSLMLQTLHVYSGWATVMEQAIAAVGNLCLRLAGNCATITSRGGIGLIAAAMRRHPEHAGVQRSGCLALRNLVVRDADRIRAAFDEGMFTQLHFNTLACFRDPCCYLQAVGIAGCEPLLQQAYIKHQVCRDVAYACLRDMGCTYAETSLGREAAERAARAIESGDIRTK